MPSRIIRASVVVTVLSLATMAASVLFQIFLAAIFGAGVATDAYLAAITIPTVVNTVFLTAMNITFIPVFIEYETKANRSEAWRVANSFIVIILAILCGVALVGSLMSESLISLIAPGLAQDEATLILAANLQRILLPAMILMAWGGLLGGLFYAQQAFVIASLAPLLGNLTGLALAWTLAATAGIYGVAIGVLAGSAIQVLFLLPCLWVKYRPPLQFAFNHPGLRQIGRLMLPWLLGAMIYKANPIVDRVVASQFSAGAISILGYAYMLAQVAVFTGSKGASLVVFPTMSRLVSSGQRQQLPLTIDTGLRLVITFMTPVAVLLLFLGETIVSVIFQRGAFSAADARLTTLALGGYSGAILALSLGNVLAYVYYALQDTKTPAIVGSLGMGLNLALALLLSNVIGFLAPAVSYSIMSLCNFAVLAMILRRRLGRLIEPGFFIFCGKVGLASLAMAAVILATRQSVVAVPALAQWSPPLQLIYHSLSGIVCYLICWGAGNRALLGQTMTRIRQRVAT
ncbi:MAG: murein biosynthesis integral membrane protein MurJ [Anaerolineae bacterium]|nr:murein biosynthesis integral membrane protein MurJ [Anaerolineae bacterium]